MYVKQRRYPESESAALVAYNGYLKGLGAGHERTRGVAAELADLYTRDRAAGESPAVAREGGKGLEARRGKPRASQRCRRSRLAMKA